MATRRKKPEAEQVERPPEEQPAEKWPLDGKTVALAEDRRPPTESGPINIGMEGSVFVPDETTQRQGFTPYKLVDGKAEDATRLLLSNFPGIYKPVVKKGE